MKQIYQVFSKIIIKIGYILKLIVSTPSYGWIIILQIISGLASFIGLPILIPILEFMQKGNLPGNSDRLLKILIIPMNYFGIKPNFHTMLLVAAILILSGQVLVIVSNLIAVYAKEDLLRRCREKIFHGYAAAEWLWLTSSHSGEMYYAVVSEAQSASTAHLNAQRILINFIQMVTFLVVAIKVSFTITILAICVYTFLGIISAINSSYLIRLVEGYNEKFKRLSNTMVGFRQNKKFFKTSLLSGKLIESISVILSEIARIMKRENDHMEIQNTLNTVFTSLFLISLMFFYEQLSLSYAMLFLILLIFFRLAPQFVALSNAYIMLDSNIPMHKSLHLHLRELNEHRERNGIEQFSENDVIRFENVSFSYPDGQRVFNNFNISIEPRKTIAFVGGSGVGKTTILDLILGLIEPNSGIIYYGDIPHYKLDKNSLRNKIAYVSQQSSLLDGTLKENLTIGYPAASDEMIENICNRVHIDQFINQLPDGYNTRIGENGIKLSGGQRQRVILGRALFTNPKILILDEATSELDSQSEMMIQETIKSLREELTIIIVAHRLSTIRLADRVYMIEDGTICECGTYEELLKQKGKFYFLDSLQK